MSMLNQSVKALTTAAEQAYNEEQNDCANYSDNEAGKVEASHSFGTEEIHNVAAQESADNADNDVGDGSHLFVPSHDDACDPAGQRAKDDPYQKVHFYLRRELRDRSIAFILSPAD
jgi:hypothetical protein